MGMEALVCMQWSGWPEGQEDVVVQVGLGAAASGLR